MDWYWLLAVDWGSFPGDKAFLSFCNSKRKSLNFGCLGSASVHTELSGSFICSGEIAARGRGITYGETASHLQTEPYGWP